MNSIRSNLHTHTSYSDGANTPEELIQEALEAGFVSLGFSDHAYAPYDTDCCMKEEALPQYLAELRQLREKYAGRLEIYIGLESDYYHVPSPDGLDFIIGSVHSIRDETTGMYHCVDSTHAAFEKALEHSGGGSVKKLVERYYGLVTDVALRQKPDIIGHLDLITKLNSDNRYFDSQSNWYLEITAATVQAIKKSGCIVEVNTGGMTRGYTTCPYPEKPVLAQLFHNRIPVTISSDAHDRKDLASCFDQAAALLWEVGYRSTLQLRQGRFVEVPL